MLMLCTNTKLVFRVGLLQALGSVAAAILLVFFGGREARYSNTGERETREEFNEQLPLFPLTKGKWVSQVSPLPVRNVNSDFLMLFQIPARSFYTTKPVVLETTMLRRHKSCYCLTKQMNSGKVSNLTFQLGS